MLVQAGEGPILASAADLDIAVLERRAIEEVGEVARRHVPLLPENSEIREQLIRLEALAPTEQPVLLTVPEEYAERFRSQARFAAASVAEALREAVQIPFRPEAQVKLTPEGRVGWKKQEGKARRQLPMVEALLCDIESDDAEIAVSAEPEIVAAAISYCLHDASEEVAATSGLPTQSAALEEVQFWRASLDAMPVRSDEVLV